jgi:hemerythrin-like domain-containing protein
MPAHARAAAAGPANVGPSQDVHRRLGIQPTPDDGTRLSNRKPWEEADRPTGPAPSTAPFSEAGRAAAATLVEVHNELREQLGTLRRLVAHVQRGTIDAAVARSQLNQMTIRRNNWTVGSYCESYCRLVTQHHGAEDESVFPHLRARDRGLAPVLDRLQQEHAVIHEVLDAIDRALVAFIARPQETSGLQEAIDLLTDALRSHLAYEERELLEPLARYGLHQGQV